MIWRLALQQARAQRRYLLVTLVFTAVAVALATFAGATGATQAVVDAEARAMRGDTGTYTDYVLLTDGEGRADAWGDVMMPVTEFSAAIDEALAAGSDAVVVAYAWVNAEGPGGDDNANVYAMGGTYDVTPWIVEGRAPLEDEAVVGAAWARAHGVSVGDTLLLSPPTWGDYPLHPGRAHVDVSVVGLLASANVPVGYEIFGPDLILGWSEPGLPAGLWDRGDDPELPTPDPGRQIGASVSWSTQAPVLTTLGQGGVAPAHAFELTIGGAWAGGFGLLVVFGVITMAFALGRSQAQRRLQWVATARTLGSTRGTLAAAATVEALATGIVAGAVGYSAGRLAADAQLAWAHRSYPHALLPDAVSHPAWVAGGALALALVLAAVVAAIPAFWAGRVPPVAALKPVTDVSESEVSRRVSPAWAWGIAAVLAWLTSVAYHGNSDALRFGTIFFALGFVVAFVAAALDACRRLAKAIGAALARRREQWAMTAGEAIQARPRQVATPMLLTLLPAAGITALVTAALMSWARNAEASFGWYAQEPTWLDAIANATVPPAVVGLGGYGVAVGAVWLFAMGAVWLFQVMCVTVTLSSARAAAADGATHQALGLTALARRLGAAAAHGIPQAVAAVIGVATGVLGVLVWDAIAPGYSSLIRNTPTVVLDVLGDAAGPLTALLLVALSAIAAGSAVVALATRTSTPVHALARTH